MSARASTTARGYGTKHQKVRAKFARLLKREGQFPCARCRLPVFHDWPLNPPSVHVPSCRKPGCEGQCWTTWDAGHTDDRTMYSGLEHASCNRAAGGSSPKARRAPTRPPRATPKAVDYGW